MTDPDMLETLASYIPALIVRRIASDPALRAAERQPVAERFQAAVLFADISGFTALTERLAQGGPAGVEELTRILNTYFGHLIDLITALGGDVVKFAGDGILALWPAGDEDLSGLSANVEPTLALAARRAVQCGLAVQMMLHDNHHLARSAKSEQENKDGEEGDGIRLSLHIGIGAGEVFAVHLGGVYGRWEFLVAGEPIRQMSIAEQQAQPGQVVLSPEAWALMQDECIGQPLPGGGVLLEDVCNPLPLRPPPLLSAGVQALAPETEAALRAYIPGAVIARLAAGQTGWLGELRRVTVLFLKLPDLDHTASLEQAQAVARALQTALYHYEGSINKMSVDDKGTTLVAALGLPPLAHEDDAVRGVLAAMAMQSELKRMGLRCAVGVTTGRAFCGSIGNEHRREYTMIGDVVNLAARLMQAVPTPAPDTALPILCDAATYEGTQDRIDFEVMPAIMVKGKAEPVVVYRPRGEKKRVVQSTETTPGVSIVGRVAERAILAESLQGFVLSHALSAAEGEVEGLVRGTGGGQGALCVIIEGEAGIGKSRLVEDLRRQAEAMRIGIFTGGGDAVEKSASYHAWRGVFSQMFDLSVMADPVAQRQHFLDLLEDEPDLLRQAPLLNPVLPFSLPETELTEQITGQAQADNTRNLLVKLLQDSVDRSPKAIILENAHWLDSASWALALVVSQRVYPLLLVIVTRPIPEPLPAEYTQLLQMPGVQHLRLPALSAEETAALVCQQWGLASLPEPVAEFIYQKAEGNPFFSQELAYALWDSGFITITEGEPHSAEVYSLIEYSRQGLAKACQVAPGVDLEALLFPSTMQGVITSRVDRLTPTQQLTLKVASVIGRVFAFRILRDVYPIEADRPHLQDSLGSLEGSDFILRDPTEPEPVYSFKHLITQEVVYNLMLFAQRRQLHQAIAAWYGHAYAADLSPYYVLLAHHYRYAGDAEGERYYARLAGEQAASRFANAEALTHLKRALELTPETNAAERYTLLLARESIYDLQGEREAQLQDLVALTRLIDGLPEYSSELELENRWRAEVSLRRSKYAFAIDDYPAAIAAARAAIRLAQAACEGDPECVLTKATGYLQWGRVLWRQGEYEKARTQLKRALALARPAQTTVTSGREQLRQPVAPRLAAAFKLVEAGSLRVLGVVHRCLGDYARARMYYVQSLYIHREIGDQRGESGTLISLGFISDCLGDYAGARVYCEQALGLCREIGYRTNESITLVNLSLIFHHLGDNETAYAYNQQALRILQEIGDRDNLGYALTYQGHTLVELGRLVEAAEAYQRALSIRRELGQHNLGLEVLAGLARVSLARGRPEDLIQALAYVEEILSHLQSKTLEGTDEPFRVYLTCYRVLREASNGKASQDPRARDVLSTAHHLLLEQAAKIGGPRGDLGSEALRRSFLENVASHRELMQEFAQNN